MPHSESGSPIVRTDRAAGPVGARPGRPGSWAPDTKLDLFSCVLIASAETVAAILSTGLGLDVYALLGAVLSSGLSAFLLAHLIPRLASGDSSRRR